MTDPQSPAGEPAHEPKLAIGRDHKVEVGVDDLPDVPHPPHRQSASQLAFGDEQPSLLEAMGGPVGMAESAIPSIAFLIATTLKAEVATASIIAVGTALVLAFARLIRRETVQFALTGLVGVAVCAAVAIFTGDAKGFFLPSFGINILYGSLALGSVIAGRPFVGYIAENLSELNDPDWRENDAKMRRYKLASLLWFGIFVSRLIVQVPIYLIDEDVVILGTIKLVMGYPLFGAGVYLTWLMVRKPKVAEETTAATDPAASAPPAAPGEPTAPVEPPKA
ncbi:MAG: DUF3159 domain-containing protein [Solirubrobacteraceae bacterium]|nr:DUF3159 domain-containing protein [Solirubrobacteraceae bacterium]